MSEHVDRFFWIAGTGCLPGILIVERIGLTEMRRVMEVSEPIEDRYQAGITDRIRDAGNILCEVLNERDRQAAEALGQDGTSE